MPIEPQCLQSVALGESFKECLLEFLLADWPWSEMVLPESSDRQRARFEDAVGSTSSVWRKPSESRYETMHRATLGPTNTDRAGRTLSSFFRALDLMPMEVRHWSTLVHIVAPLAPTITTQF